MIIDIVREIELPMKVQNNIRLNNKIISSPLITNWGFFEDGRCQGKKWFFWSILCHPQILAMNKN